MQKNKKRALQSCSHFVNRMKTCSLFVDGFYIPPEETILAYCKSSKYNKCPIYKRHHQRDKGRKAIDSGAKIADSRRRFERISDQRKVLICTCDALDGKNGDFAETALTVDYCQGGMRIIVDKEVPADIPLIFKFDNDFVVPRLQGLAQLCWQKNLEKFPQHIEAGLAFKDDFSRQSLNLSIEHNKSNPVNFSEISH
ncbi:MAG: hypothetical protein C4548_09575 [Desulfobacteraceae bacterium]|nr:MAG: hypothetical protein C4548_09575 [Desulfobacteraceae bacterium]